MNTAVRWVFLVVLVAALIGLCWLLALAGKAGPDDALAGPWVHYGGRIALVAAALSAWFITQKLIGSRAPLAEGTIGDLVHDLAAPVNRWLHAHPRAADRLLIGSSFGIDVFGLTLIGAGLLGETLRPFMALLLLFFFRQVCQACCALPAPPRIIWRHQVRRRSW